METPALGNLAYAVLDQHGAAAEAAVAGILSRVRLAVPADRAPQLVGGVYAERQAARQPLQPGNWVTLGEIIAAAGITFVDVNITTGAIRERCAWLRRGCPERRLLPARSVQGTCRHAS